MKQMMMKEMSEMKETNEIIMKTFYKYGVLGAWKGDGGLVVRVEGGHDGDAPVKHHVQHPLFFAPPALFAQHCFRAKQRLWLLWFLSAVLACRKKLVIFFGMKTSAI